MIYSGGATGKRPNDEALCWLCSRNLVSNGTFPIRLGIWIIRRRAPFRDSLPCASLLVWQRLLREAAGPFLSQGLIGWWRISLATKTLNCSNRLTRATL